MTRRAIAARLSVSFYLDRNHSLVRESSEFPPFPRISDCFLLARSEIFLSLRNSMQTNESNGMLQATFCFSDTAKHRQTPPNTAKHRQTPRNAAGTALPSTIPSGSKLASAAVRVFSKMDAISFNNSPTNTTRETSSPAFSRASRASAASLLVDEILDQVRNR